MSIKNFTELTSRLRSRHIHKRVAVVCPNDVSTQQAIHRAQEEWLVEPLIFDDHDPRQATCQAVAAARRGEVDVLMKGFVNTDVFLHPILNKETGLLPPGRVLTHVSVAQMRAYHKLLFFTDVAVIPYPSEAQRRAQVECIVDFCHKFDIGEPKVALIHCSEKVDTKHFPYTAGYGQLKAMAEAGEFGPCVVDGPLDLKTSCSAESLAVKHISSPIGGDADALVFPDIEAGNLFYKTITLFCGAKTAGVLQGTSLPVVLPSRADQPENKYLSLCVACLL